MGKVTRSQTLLLYETTLQVRGQQGLVISVCQLLYSVSKTLFILNTLNPVCIYINPLKALPQSSSNGGHRMAGKELLYFLRLLKGSKLYQQKTEEKNGIIIEHSVTITQYSRMRGSLLRKPMENAHRDGAGDKPVRQLY
jgi:hypothetical protein